MRVVGLMGFDCAAYDDRGDDLARAVLHLQIFDLSGPLSADEAVGRAEPLIEYFLAEHVKRRTTDSLFFMPYLRQITSATGLHIGVLYFLKGLHSVEKCHDLMRLTYAIDGAKGFRP
jgi:hypothetical protein